METEIKGYRICTHEDVGDQPGLLRALAELNALTFGRYEAVVVPSPEFMAWYARRPGMDPRLCQAAFAGERLVASAFVTLLEMRLRGESVQCAIVDTVMTHPNHRRKGLARALLQRAHRAMERAGADVALLNTAQADPPAGPQQLYESLGYRPVELVDRWVTRRASAAGACALDSVGVGEDVRRAMQARLGRRDGWLELDKDLWLWRRAGRPPAYPAAVMRTSQDVLAAVCTGPLLSGGEERPFAVLSDFAPSEDADWEAAVRELLSAVPAGATATMLCGRSDTKLAGALQVYAFSKSETRVKL
ncbi:MAG: GNAT family N-acetyltransferase [Armatimonadetes bacterium]|nr:GNAT family N-acetyltransferase [Armatimonadota bacterium]